jgi:cold shock CspA family protein
LRVPCGPSRRELKAGLTKLNEGQQIEFQLEESRGNASTVNLKVK